MASALDTGLNRQAISMTVYGINCAILVPVRVFSDLGLGGDGEGS